jgi:hypothetical protein
LNRRGQRVSEYLGLRLHRAGWLSGSWRRRQLPNWIRAFLHLRFKASADACRAEIAHGLAVRGTRGYRPSQRDPISLAASTEIGRWFRKFEGWRERGSSLGATGEQDAESRRQTEIACQGSHWKRKSIRGPLWAPSGIHQKRRGTPRLYQSIKTMVSAASRVTRLAHQFPYRLAKNFAVEIHVLGRGRGRH